MTKWWMLTMPRFEGVVPLIKDFLQRADIHQWALCEETGKTGYEHVHLKINCTESITWEQLSAAFPLAHIEPSNDNVQYLRKEGSKFQSSEDTPAVIEVREGTLRPWQESLVSRVLHQSSRQVTVLYDEGGGIGKSWLAGYLYENSLSLFIPPILETPKEMVQFICSLYRGQKMIVIDIPRSWKWSQKLATSIEVVKDGLIFDTRYTAKVKHIRGVCVLVFTNEKVPEKFLSKDRWDIVRVSEGALVYSAR